MSDDVQLDFHRKIAGQNLSALWVARRGVDLTRPRSEATPTAWRYADVRPALMEAGEIVTAKDAFRRVLALANPTWPDEMRATNTLYCGLQLVRPGELAPCHRHTQTAIRFVIEGEGAITSVDGERTRMKPGDFVVTSSWTWHDHVNEGAEPVVWLDCLDSPLVAFLDLAFREGYPEERHPERPPGPGDNRRPPLNYPYKEMRARLMRAVTEGTKTDAVHGTRLGYANPLTGASPTPSIGATLRYLPAGFDGVPARVTDGTVYVCVEGRGHTEIDGARFDWGPHDIVVVPGWKQFRHAADQDSILFSLSDRPVQEALGLWREERAG